MVEQMVSGDKVTVAMVQAVAEGFIQTEGQAIMVQVEQALFRGA